MSDDLYDLNGLAASLQGALDEELAAAGAPVGAAPAVELALSARPEHGDVTTNAALVSAKKSGRAPRELAEAVGARWLAGPGAGVCDRFEVAGPGFLNLFLTDSWYRGALDRLLAEGGDYGRGSLPAGARQRMNVEFVSVNPTGPLHVGHARYASYGDALCRILAFVGHDVTREFYVNDYGTQMTRFGQSLAARYGERLGLDVPVPEEGYQGDYLLDLADELIAAVGNRHREAIAAVAPDVTALPDDLLGEIKLWGRDAILAQFRVTLEGLRVPFDVWTSESSLYEGDGEHRGFGGEVGKSLADLDGEQLLYDEGGAAWLATTRYGDDKDRVLIRQTGDPTYFLSDIAYHRDKMDRGFEHMIDIWGADHHGYVPRMKAAFTALPPHDPDKLELIIGQLVSLLESGEARRMSKRRGDIVTVDDLIDAIGVDAARFLLVGRSHDTTLELDIDLAVQQNNQNPVYYVQYAHARICSILRNLPGEGRPAGGAVPAVTLDPHERALLRALARFPDILVNAAEQRAPHRVHGYLGELAAEFHVFYRHCRVLSDDADVTAFRSALCAAVRSTLAAGLGLLGVGAPESM
ncbi:MAG TPA: arginine--tRNA ligase [Thermoleophilia bacterium]|nr:arginine--tRNA ligase [Thermoleophilia bacterium]